jgi:hypothetical protein
VVSAIHLGNVETLGKPRRYKCFMLNVSVRFSLFNDRFKFSHLLIYKVCNLGKRYRGKDSREPHDAKYNSSMEGSFSLNKNFMLSQ